MLIVVIYVSFELNLSVRQSGFTLYRKHKPCLEDENKIKVRRNFFVFIINVLGTY